MASFNQLVPSLLNGRLEIAPALANLNFDFALWKVDAPKEYQGVGQNLSTLRRVNAEGGASHITARKLGALFERVLPSTPNLIKTYGRRASEISSSMAIDSKDLDNYGIFSSQVGVDATSLWAAATSGDSAMAVHLLACMLARIWDSPEATSIWAEIVEHRRKEIVAAFERDNIGEYTVLAAAKQEFARGQFREWDASARAWLQVADAAKGKQQKQLNLIIDNLETSVNNKPDTYSSVIEAWKSSLIQMEGLVNGIAQTAQRGDILLALSAWHLYPDMMVLHPSVAHVLQKDDLFSSGAVLTIGIDLPIKQDGGVYWSLPLSQLRHYGKPVVSRRSIESGERSRLSLHDLLLATLGCFLHGWGEAGKDTVAATKWLCSLSRILTKEATKGSNKPQI